MLQPLNLKSVAALTMSSLALMCDDDWAVCFGYSAILTGPAGLGMGVGIDAMVKDRRLVYMSNAITGPLRLRLSPLITPADKGVQFSLDW